MAARAGAKAVANWVVSDARAASCGRGRAALRGEALPSCAPHRGRDDLGKIAKEVFAEMVNRRAPKAIVAQRGIERIADAARSSRGPGVVDENAEMAARAQLRSVPNPGLLARSSASNT